MPRDPELARRLNLLFDVMHRRGETPLSTAAAAAAMTAHAGAGVTMAALEELRLGNSAAASCVLTGRCTHSRTSRPPTASTPEAHHRARHGLGGGCSNG